MKRIGAEFYRSLDKKYILTPLNKSAIWYAEILHNNDLLTRAHYKALNDAAKIYPKDTDKSNYVKSWIEMRCSRCLFP